MYKNSFLKRNLSTINQTSQTESFVNHANNRLKRSERMRN
jgi:hypothetical protein